MSTKALTTIYILACLTLNIPNAKSIAIQFATSLSLSPLPDWDSFRGGIMNFEESGNTLVQQLAEQVDTTAAAQITFGGSFTVHNALGGVTIQTVFESSSLSSLETITQGLEATVGDFIPEIIAPAGGSNLAAGSVTIDDAVILSPLPTVNPPISIPFAASFDLTSADFVAFAGDATLSVAGSRIVEGLATATVPEVAVRVDFDESTVKLNPVDGITIETTLISESALDLEIVTQALEGLIGADMPAIESPGAGDDIEDGSTTIIDAVTVRPLPAPIPMFVKSITITTGYRNSPPHGPFERLIGSSTLSIAGTTIVETTAVDADPVATAAIDFGPSTASLWEDDRIRVLIQTTMISDSEETLNALVAAVANLTLLPAISAPAGSGGTDIPGGIKLHDVTTSPTEATLTPSSTASDDSSDGDDDDGSDDDSDDDSSDDNTAALYDENQQLNDNNNAANDGTKTNEISLSFSNQTLMNIWILFGVFMVANVICCFMCNKTKRGVTNVVNESYTV